jgi:hypothetical protein
VHKGLLDERPDGKRPLGKPRSRFKDNIMDLKEGRWGAWT